MADRSWRPSEPTLLPTRNRGLSVILAATAVFGTVQRLAILRLDPQELLARYGSDDLFYYTEVARHLAIGRPLTFDGVHATSGVQPLWLALLAPWARLFDGEPSRALRLDLALVTVLTLASGLLMPRFVRAVMRPEPSRLMSDRQVQMLGTLAGCIWLAHPRVLRVTFEGTEGALAALCWQVSVLAWTDERSTLKSVRFGLALGIGTLARIDHLALLGSLFARSRFLRHSLRRTALVFLPVVALWGSWLLFCVLTTGSFIPDSGAAKRLAQERAYALDLPSTAGTWATGWHYLRIDARQLWELVPLLFHTGRHVSRLSVCAMLVMTVLLAMAIRRRQGTQAALGLRQAIVQALPASASVFQSFWPVFVPAAAVLPGYVLVLHQVRNWYAIPAQLSITLIASALCMDTVRKLAPTLGLAERPHLLALTCFSWLTAAWTEQIVWPPRTWHPSCVVAAERLVALTPTDARIGAFNAGIFGAFASKGARRVTNLDGVVNHGALRATESRTLTDYIDGEQIEFIADFPTTVLFGERIAAPGLGAQLEPMESIIIEDGRPETIEIWHVRVSPTRTSSEK
jgi:hypothetical protein